jgi:N-methylhydantoinase B/oxoprolinase/acetone carboxylase alpha subunit
VRIAIPAGSFPNAQHPAAMCAGDTETPQRVANTVLRAFAELAPVRIPAASQRTMNLVSAGGEGLVHTLRVIDHKARVSFSSDRRRHAPYGLRGGVSGAPGRNLVWPLQAPARVQASKTSSAWGQERPSSSRRRAGAAGARRRTRAEVARHRLGPTASTTMATARHAVGP